MSTMDDDEVLLLEWEDDTAFTDFPDDTSFHPHSDNLCSGERNRISSREENSFGKMDNDLDYAIAMSLQNAFDDEFKENANTYSEKSEASKPLSIVDEQWELIDPHPDIHALFVEYDDKFFYGKLKSVEVRWSPRMTLCAGICSYQGKGGLCSIALSMPLLKLRPRRDLIETLLHEMIHAYLFVTQNNRDREGHGPEFLSHMHRINKESGTKITVYHSFHAEVNLYKQHWWKCDGPCRNRSPYFGLVKRAMNRAPGPNDNWWAAHQQSCGGKFVKVKEPSNFSEKKIPKRKLHSESKSNQSVSDIRKFVKVSNPEPGNKESNKRSVSDVKPSTSLIQETNLLTKDLLAEISTTKIATKEKFIPFQGTGHKLGKSAGASQALLNFPSLNSKDLKLKVIKGDIPVTSMGNSLRKGVMFSSSSGKTLTDGDLHFGSPSKALIKRDSFSSSPGKKLIKRDSPFSVPVKTLTVTPSKKTSKISSISSASKTLNFQKGYNLSSSTSSTNTKESNKNAVGSGLPSRVSSDCLQESCITGVNFSNNVNTNFYCPVCFNLVKEEINSHLDKCLKI